MDNIRLNKKKHKREIWMLFFLYAIIFFSQEHSFTISLQAKNSFQPSAKISALSTVEGNQNRRAIFSLFGIISVLVLIIRPKRFKILSKRLLWLIILFIIWTFLSILWANQLNLYLRRFVLFIIVCLGTLALCKILKEQELLGFVIRLTGLFILIGFITECVLGTFKPFSVDYRFAGTIHPNEQAIICSIFSISAAYIVITKRNARKKYLAYLILGILFLILTKTRTSFGSTVVIIFIIWSVKARRSRKATVFISTGLFIGLVILFNGENILPILEKSLLLGRTDSRNTATLTDRIPLWKECFEFVKKKPLCGYGYGSFWSMEHIFAIAASQHKENPEGQGWGASGSCSVYIELLLGLGLIGLILYICIFIMAIRISFHGYRNNSTYLYFGALLANTVLNGVMMSSYSKPSMSTMITWAILVFLAIKNQEKNSIGHAVLK
jgi:exopolysaccharide production protein ExoQ